LKNPQDAFESKETFVPMPQNSLTGSVERQNNGEHPIPLQRTVRWRRAAGHSAAASHPAVQDPAAVEPPDRVRLQLLADHVGEDEGVFREGVRRGLNIVVALVGIVITAPLMVLIAIAVKVTSRGPVIFTQERVGLDRRWRRSASAPDIRRKTDLGGRIFRIYKFRTMTHCEERSREQRWATPDDPRITPIGRFLRNTRMDELPQFFNVLKGDMNIVGPRPEQPEIFQAMRQEVDEYQKRQRVLPGITGLAQVKHHYDRSVSDVEIKVSHDLEYVSRVSTLEDLRIMARTIPVIIFRKGGW
jgi:lipopolysaccharide/colanic/teichoic acid biosynthesis glycosyltransferase